MSFVSDIQPRSVPEWENVLALLQQLKDWQDHDYVAGSGDYDRGLKCGVEDHGFQGDGYSAMRYGYDSALARCAESVDPLVAELIEIVEAAIIAAK